MNVRTIIALGAIAAVSACGKTGESGNAADNGAAPPPAAQIEPGLYRQATTLVEMKDPTLSADEAAAAAKAIGTTQTAERCVTPEMLENPKKIVMSGAEEGCTVERSTWEGGKIDIAMTCPEGENTSAGAMTLSGSYGSDRYSIAMAMNGNEGEVMRMKVEAKRLGDCPAK